MAYTYDETCEKANEIVSVLLFDQAMEIACLGGDWYKRPNAERYAILITKATQQYLGRNMQGDDDREWFKAHEKMVRRSLSPKA